MLAKINSCTVIGIEGSIIEVEVDISYGLPVFNIVGLPETAVKESKERVKTAVKNSGYNFPMDRVVVNLAPADIKKEGTGFDLPIAVGILMAAEIFSSVNIRDYLIAGELSLDGRLKPIKGILPYAMKARQKGFKGIIIPSENAKEAAIVKDFDVFPFKNLSQIVDFLSGSKTVEKYEPERTLPENPETYEFDFSEVKGQNHAKRALEIAAAGGHNILMTGPPGSGKSMMAKRLPTILPGLTFKEAVEVTMIYSVSGLLKDRDALIKARPFRSPHHTVSDAGLVGGGAKPVPGEISLAHNGVLFLDELPEFRKNALEVLRQPLEDGVVTIARAGRRAKYPSLFMLVAAMNPCPCGYFSDPLGRCICTQPQIQRYRSKISGPLLDRIDIQIEVPRIEYKDLISRKKSHTSFEIRKKVQKARKLQEKRFKNSKLLWNSKISARLLKNFCHLDSGCEKILEQAVKTFGLSARSYHSIIKVGRTIADLESSPEIKRKHIAESIQYRNFERKPVY